MQIKFAITISWLGTTLKEFSASAGTTSAELFAWVYLQQFAPHTLLMLHLRSELACCWLGL
jgi:hypothetical protein